MLNFNTTNTEDLRIYQIIDANLDRSREGLRVLEDWAVSGIHFLCCISGGSYGRN